jgi:protein-S-isoprenylcysteine O-methyltransferase Ste14
MTRVPALGPRGEGWVAIQFVLLGLMAVGGFVSNGAWTREVRSVTTLIGVLRAVAGMVIAIRGGVDLREALTPFPRPQPGTGLVQTGAYVLVRHPIYTGVILGALG